MSIPVVMQLVENLYKCDLRLAPLSFNSNDERVTYENLVAVKSACQLECFVRDGDILPDKLFSFFRSSRLASSDVLKLVTEPRYVELLINGRMGFRPVRPGPAMGVHYGIRAYGHSREASARERYAQLTGDQVYQFRNFVNANFPWIIATPDGIVVRNGQVICGLECKSPRKRSDRDDFACQGQVFRVGDSWALDPCGSIYAQVQVCMAVTGIKLWKLAVNFFDKLYVIDVPYDRIYCEILLHKASQVFAQTYLPALHYYNWLCQMSLEK
jgi:hypothetical protein